MRIKWLGQVQAGDQMTARNAGAYLWGVVDEVRLGFLVLRLVGTKSEVTFDLYVNDGWVFDTTEVVS
jgi:hypothetical protein